VFPHKLSAPDSSITSFITLYDMNELFVEGKTEKSDEKSIFMNLRICSHESGADSL